ncbi:DUF1120 domain-containing protein [Herbaspirillum sp. RV1423]|uniref:DUF1120 domain-containing protein n=1 Tax=Herbaspirillum sp. RV1423 TaxID=1443993 RepID=UPI0004B34151|nr:DUF1120 domain-containing protein [Herbaspirillum sp. RV1423]
MKKIALLSTLALALTVSFGAQAADTAELKVKGVIKPAACKPNFSSGGVVDYGDIPAASLTAGQYKKLVTKQVDFRIDCDAATKMAIKLTDNRASSRVPGITGAATDPYNYGLGTVNGKQVGGYSLSFDASTMTDGNSVRNIFSPDGGKSWYGGAVNIQHDGEYFSFGDTNNLPVAFKQLTAKINIDTVLNKPENLNLSNDVPLDGSSTIEVIYL